MGDRTGISWTGRTWNPIRGCSRVSEGCRHCYAEVQAARIVRMGRGKPTPYDGLVRMVRRPPSAAEGYRNERPMEPRWTGEVVLDVAKLAEPMRWRQPSTVFVNSMSDLFHEKLTNEQIAAVFGVMATCPQHTFQCLTKRARRMREWFEWFRLQCDPRSGAETEVLIGYLLDEAPDSIGDRIFAGARWPLPNVWLGVSVENQDAADERIPDMLQTPAAVRFLSCEPLLGPVDLNRIQTPEATQGLHFSALHEQHDDCFHTSPSQIDWVIAGCESGPGARPCDVEWLRALRDQCAAAGVPFFLKQAIGASRSDPSPSPGVVPIGFSRHRPIDTGPGSKRKPGGVIELPYLDGVQHAAFPKVVR